LPANKLDDFGKEKLDLEKLNLTESIERYLDSKRSPLLFSKAVLLVEGDGEEILIPSLVKKVFGVSLDELGVSLINIGGISFEYIASLFHDDRIQRYCAIITDLDKQVVEESSSYYKVTAEQRGQTRKEKLDRLFGANKWVDSFYANSTLEIEFIEGNEIFIEEIIKEHYKKNTTITDHVKLLNGTDDCKKANTVMTLASAIGKGWYAILLAQKITCAVKIPDYILDALSFASQEVLSIDIVMKMLEKSVFDYEESEEKDEIENLLKMDNSNEKKKEIIQLFLNRYETDPLSKFIKFSTPRIEWW
jgi:predicted ATP-dependent endonuclease of OLD family